MKTCPFCAETVKAAAIVCKHCGRDIASASGAAPTSPATPPPAPMPSWLHSPIGARQFALFGALALAVGWGGLVAMSHAAPTLGTTGDGAPPAAPPKPTVLALVDESSVSVPVERWLDYGFTTPSAGAACRLTGRVVGLYGGNRDVEVYVLSADAYVNWQTGSDAATRASAFAAPRQTVTSFDIELRPSGEYHLVISNRFSVLRSKDVQAEARVTCTPAA